MFNILLPIFLRDIKLAFRKGGQALHIAAFFIIVLLLFVLALGSEPQKLQEIGAGAVWVAALLALTVGFPSFFQADYDDGSLEQLLLQPIAFEWVIASKYLAGWIVYSLPLIAISPVLAIMLQLPANAIIPLMSSLIAGTPGIIAIGGLGAALVLANRRTGVLLSLLIMPLYIPLLIFGSGAISSITGDAAEFSFQLLAAGTLTAIPLSCWVAAFIIKTLLK